jgi:aminoglycoside phosphotransferase (APT) family kinase protein
MRNEYAASPFMAALGPVVPRIIAADFTHQVVARDYVFQNLLPGLPASEVLPRYPEEKWPDYYRQLGRLTAVIHEVRGERFGRVTGPFHDTWSQEVEHRLATASSVYTRGGLDNAQVERLRALVTHHRAALDQLRTPRLLHGDLWLINTLIDPAADEPTITGVLDHDGARWGDPLADAPVHSALQREGTAADAFWEAYPRPATDGGTAVRRLFAWALNVIGIRLDIHRRGLDLATIPAKHWDVTGTLRQLGG